MAHMTLPAAHTEADFRLAERIGCALRLDEVHVFWTLPAAPARCAKRADPPRGLIGALAARCLFSRPWSRLRQSGRR